MISEEENNIKSYGLRFIIDAINYLIQNHRQEDGYNLLYSKYLDVL